MQLIKKLSHTNNGTAIYCYFCVIIYPNGVFMTDNLSLVVIKTGCPIYTAGIFRLHTLFRTTALLLETP